MKVGNKAGFDNKASGSVTRKRSTGNDFKPEGRYKVEHWRQGKLLGIYDVPNGVTNAGKTNILDVHFHGGTQITTWYIGLINNAGFSALAAADTMASHGGWVEYQDYDESTRVAWAEDAPASQAITSLTLSEFTINGTTDEVKGVFLNSVSTKGGTTGTLWGTAAFASVIPVDSGDVLKVTYSVTAS